MTAPSTIGRIAKCVVDLPRQFDCLWREHSLTALLALLASELAIGLWQYGYMSGTFCACIVLALAIFLVLIAHMAVKNRTMIIDIPAIFTKLLSNAIVPRWLGVSYLLMFVVHISWLTDGGLGLLTHAINGNPPLSLAAGTVGVIVLIIFFPDGRKHKLTNPVTVFVSGISRVAPPPPPDKDYSKLNLLPLVRILQLVPDGASAPCEMLILASDTPHRVDELMQYLGVDSSTSDMSIEDKLQLVIRTVAKREFPGKKWIDAMPIAFTRPCDYNDFPQCSRELMAQVTSLDDASHKLIFNLTPGTGVVGSLMTLMAIDAGRDLYYYGQQEGLAKEKRLKVVDKSQIPLHNLLSQALESLG